MKTAHDMGAIASQIAQILEIIVRLSLLLLLLAVVLGHLGWRPPILPRLGSQELLYLCGAWLAYRWRA